MKETIQRLMDANRQFATTGKYSGDISEHRRAENSKGQTPYAAIVTCSDSRVIPEAIFSAGIGELFVVRTAGNVIGDAELASLHYAIEHLHVKTVIVMGHTGCGAVNAALCGEFDGAVGTITRRIKDAIKNETDPYQACVLNVKHGAAMLQKALCREDIAVIGALYDIVSGKVDLVCGDP